MFVGLVLSGLTLSLRIIKAPKTSPSGSLAPHPSLVR